MSKKITHIYEVHAKSPKTKNQWRVYETHDNEESAIKAANSYKLGAENANKKGFSVKVVKIQRLETPVSERVISNSVKKSGPKTNLEKMTDPKAKINSKKASDRKPRKKPVEGTLPLPAKPSLPSSKVLPKKRGA